MTRHSGKKWAAGSKLN